MTDELSKQIAVSIFGEAEWRALAPSQKLVMLRVTRWLIDAIGADNVDPSLDTKAEILAHLTRIKRSIDRQEASMQDVDAWLDSRLKHLRKEWFLP